MENMDIEAYAEICKFGEKSKVARLDPHIMISSERTEDELYMSGTTVEYPEEHDFNQPNTTTPPKRN